MTKSGDILIQNGDGRWLKFSRPHRFYFATELSEIPGVLDSVDSEIANGVPVAGFMSYEAAAGIDPAFDTHLSSNLPLAWFGVYDAPEVLDSLPLPSQVCPHLSWKNSLTEADYSALIDRIKAYIAAGDTYQVNFTIRLNSIFSGDPYALFHRLQESQQSNSAAYIETDDFTICSASPELFFEIDGDSILMRPMKGTARRGTSFDDDQRCIRELSESPKNRAENVMIVDMIRNDLGRIAEAGSVCVTSLFDIERYPTVLQMTSTVEAVTQKPFSELIRALFPCSSITGAPKVRTMQIIRELEDSPRGIYTGSIGYWLPERQARFNVAIRTAVVDKSSGEAIYGVGGGIVWDSVDSHELDECLAKAEVLNADVERFDILETILWTAKDGFYLLEEHIERAANSALYFGYKFDESIVRSKLEDVSRSLNPAKRDDRGEGTPAPREGASALRNEFGELEERESAPLSEWRAPPGGRCGLKSNSLGVGDGRLASRSCRVRLLLGRDGAVVEAVPLNSMDGIRHVGVVPNSAKSDDIFLYHKTTKRSVYAAAKNRMSDCDDVLLMNERGEITESTIANLVVEIDGKRITPPVSSGLLAGTFRGKLLEQGEIIEAIVTEDILRRADAVWLINSVRGWMSVEVDDSGCAGAGLIGDLRPTLIAKQGDESR